MNCLVGSTELDDGGTDGPVLRYDDLVSGNE